MSKRKRNKKYNGVDRDAIIVDNIPLVKHIVKRYRNVSETIPGTDMEDLISIGTIGLIKGVDTYDPSNGVSFSTYIGVRINNEILLYFRRNKKYRKEVISLNSVLSTDNSGNEFTLADVLSSEEDDISKIIDSIEDTSLAHCILNSLSEKDRLFIELRYGFNNGGQLMNQSEIAKVFNISQSYTSRKEKMILDKLRARYCDYI